MRNPDLPKLLRELYLPSIETAMVKQAALELEKLEKIYKLSEEKDAPNCLYELYKILDEK